MCSAAAHSCLRSWPADPNGHKSGTSTSACHRAPCIPNKTMCYITSIAESSNTHTYILMHTYIHTHTPAYIHTHIHTHAYIHTHPYSCIHTYTHTYFMHTHIHTYILHAHTSIPAVAVCCRWLSGGPV